MNRQLIGALLMAVTALTPIAAQAQDRGFGGRVLREARQERSSGDAPRARPERSAPAPRAERQPAPQASTNPQPRQQWQGRRGGDGNHGGQQQQSWRGNDGGNRWQGQRGDAGAQQSDAAQREAYAQRAANAQRWRERNGDANRGQQAEGGNWRAQQSGGWRAQANQDRRGNDARWNDRNGNGRSDGQRWNDRRDNGVGQQVLRDARRADQRRSDNRYSNRQYDNRRYDNRYDSRYDSRRNDDRRWNTGWRNDRRYDWRSYRTRNVNTYRVGRYYSPYNNWSYRRLSIGFSLWPLFYSNQYWINDPWQYRLPEVYGPYRWVRYYDDAMLVDIYSGEVVDVIYDFFW